MFIELFVVTFDFLTKFYATFNMDYYLVCSVKKLLDALVFIRISPKSSVYSTKNVVKNWKKIEKKG